ncbi:MAG: hypothetical protein AAGG51_12215 [Cyanobacteria bacterium P01_G01_bin.54]
MTESLADLYQAAVQRYNDGETAANLIPVFREICDRSGRKNAAAWSSLAWLYLLDDKPEKAVRAAQKGVKADSHAPQARINLALAMLDSGEKGVRKHIEVAQETMSLSSELRDDVLENIKDGLERKPDWANLKRVQKWLFD